MRPRPQLKAAGNPRHTIAWCSVRRLPRKQFPQHGAHGTARGFLQFSDAKRPGDLQPTDVLKVYVLSDHASTCYVDDVQAEAFSPKTGW